MRYDGAEGLSISAFLFSAKEGGVVYCDRDMSRCPNGEERPTRLLMVNLVLLSTISSTNSSKIAIERTVAGHCKRRQRKGLK